MIFTPSRELAEAHIYSYGVTFVLDFAAHHGGVDITRDSYRDLVNKKKWREVVEKRILMPTFAGDDLMLPHDHDLLGGDGPNLDQLLRF